MGFFEREETKSASRPDGLVYSCASCGLYRNCETPKMEAFGNGRKGILTIGEAPREPEDRAGKPWQGKDGRSLQRILKSLGIDLFEDCVSINAVNCLMEDGSPTNYQVACCRAMVHRVIERVQPQVILLFGGAALDSVIGHRWKKDLGGINKWRGFTIPDRDLKAWVCPVFHPSWVDKQSGFDEVETIWKLDLKGALECLEKPRPVQKDDRSCIEYVADSDVSKTLAMINKTYEGNVAFFDYETTGLKPHAVGHRIVCTAISPDPKSVYVFMGPKTKETKINLGKFLSNPSIGKGASNLKFEHVWSSVRIGMAPRAWVWDTMQAAHVLDNRPGITSLKFQAFIELGVVDYDSEIHPFLTGKAPGEDPKSANSKNRILELVKAGREKEIMTYCALDALYEHQLGLIQMRKLGYFPDFYPPF